MSVETIPGITAETVENSLRDELADSEISLVTTRPILHHLLAHADHDLFSDEVIARVRGMLTHIARQIMFFVARHQKIADRSALADQWQGEIATGLAANGSLVGFAHALAIEALTAERLSTRSGIDAVLSPLLQELVASQNGGQARGAMQALSAQARFMQQARRMELPLAELPLDDLNTVCAECEARLQDAFSDIADALTRVREEHESASSRIDLLKTLINDLGREPQRALNIDHAGVAIFITALQIANEQSRETAVHLLGEHQFARLALSLRAAGLSASLVEEQFLYLHPDISLPDGFDMLRAERASSLLANSHARMQRAS